MILVFYDSTKSLEDKLMDKQYQKSLTGDPWMFKTENNLEVYFHKAPTWEEVPGLIASLRPFGFVDAVFINDEQPFISASKIRAAFELCRRLGIEEPTIFNKFN